METLCHMGSMLRRMDNKLSGKVNCGEFKQLEGRMTALEEKKGER